MSLAKISTKNFTYVKDASGLGGVFVIERSTLDSLGGLNSVPGSPMAIGFILVSQWTDMEAQFRLTNVEVDADGDVTKWVLTPTFSAYNQPGCRHLQWIKVHVFNT